MSIILLLIACLLPAFAYLVLILVTMYHHALCWCVLWLAQAIAVACSDQLDHV
jgi:hypothetical protein